MWMKIWKEIWNWHQYLKKRGLSVMFLSFLIRWDRHGALVKQSHLSILSSHNPPCNRSSDDKFSSTVCVPATILCKSCSDGCSNERWCRSLWGRLKLDWCVSFKDVFICPRHELQFSCQFYHWWSPQMVHSSNWEKMRWQVIIRASWYVENCASL